MIQLNFDKLFYRLLAGGAVDAQICEFYFLIQVLLRFFLDSPLASVGLAEPPHIRHHPIDLSFFLRISRR